MTPSTTEHRSQGLQHLNLAVVTISDTRTLETDTSGPTIARLAEAAGHSILDRRIVRDEPDSIRALLQSYAIRAELHAALLTGGTGISPRDRTYETVSGMLDVEIPGYGELFRMLSYAEIGSACLMSRAVGGLIGPLAVFVMPGSRAAVSLAMTKIILPELPHVVHEARKV